MNIVLLRLIESDKVFLQRGIYTILGQPGKINVVLDHPIVGRPVCKNKTFAIFENVSFHCQYCAAAAVGRPYHHGNCDFKMLSQTWSVRASQCVIL